MQEDEHKGHSASLNNLINIKKPQDGNSSHKGVENIARLGDKAHLLHGS